MQIHIVLLKNIFAGIFLTIMFTGIIIASGYRFLRRKFKKRVRSEKELSLVKQTHDEFEKLLSHNIAFPIAMM